MRKLDNIQNHNSSEELMPKVTRHPQVYVSGETACTSTGSGEAKHDGKARPL